MRDPMELIHQIKNRCIIAEYIEGRPDFPKLLATLCEDNHEDSQELIDTCCVVQK